MFHMTVSRTDPRTARRAVLRAEAIGIVILALAGFALVLLRYGRFIDWHAR